MISKVFFVHNTMVQMKLSDNVKWGKWCGVFISIFKMIERDFRKVKFFFFANAKINSH